MTSLLLISNGHGEDFIAARLAHALRRLLPDLEMAALPLVGEGVQLEQAGVPVVGPRQRLPSDGFTLHHPSLLWRDLRAGLLPLTLAQARFLRGYEVSHVLVVGDVYAQLHAALVRAPRRVLQPLVSVHHAQGAGATRPLRYFMERFRAPELFLLRRAAKVYCRDAATADYLRQRGVANSAYLGNPMMDGLAAEPLRLPQSGEERPAVVALLPGSRDQARTSVALMTAALEQTPAVHGLVAWTHGEAPLLAPGWELESVSEPGVVAAWRRLDGQRLWWVTGRFAAVLASAEVALGTAGTANEQAVGLGLPVIAFPVPPLFGSAYLRNQARLLGSGLLVSEADAGAVATLLRKVLADGSYRAAAQRAGAERMGVAGASQALADDLASWLNDGSSARPSARADARPGGELGR